MTFVDYFLQELSGGNCPRCGTQVVIQVEEKPQPKVWENANLISEIRAVLIRDLGLSVRTRRSLEKVGISTVGELLDSTEARIRQKLAVSDSVIAEIRELLASKRLSIPSS